MSFSVSGKTAIVTGAAAGIGLAIARHLADQGANVMCADANEKQLMDWSRENVVERVLHCRQVVVKVPDDIRRNHGQKGRKKGHGC